MASEIDAAKRWKSMQYRAIGQKEALIHGQSTLQRLYGITLRSDGCDPRLKERVSQSTIRSDYISVRRQP